MLTKLECTKKRWLYVLLNNSTSDGGSFVSCLSSYLFLSYCHGSDVIMRAGKQLFPFLKHSVSSWHCWQLAYLFKTQHSLS